MVGIVELLDAPGLEAGLLVLPFAIFGLLWAVGHVAFGGGTDDGERVEPPSPNQQRRAIPGGRGDKSD